MTYGAFSVMTRLARESSLGTCLVNSRAHFYRDFRRRLHAEQLGPELLVRVERVRLAAHPVYLATDVVSVLRGRPFRENGSAKLREAASHGDPSIKSVTVSAKKVGTFDVLCVDSGMDGAGTCGWGHTAMVAKGAFVVRP